MTVWIPIFLVHLTFLCLNISLSICLYSWQTYPCVPLSTNSSFQSLNILSLSLSLSLFYIPNSTCVQQWVVLSVISFACQNELIFYLRYQTVPFINFEIEIISLLFFSILKAHMHLRLCYFCGVGRGGREWVKLNEWKKKIFDKSSYPNTSSRYTVCFLLHILPFLLFLNSFH